MAATLDCPFFHADISAYRKREILRELGEGQIRMVVATNALGLGVDISDIRVVVHAGAPDSLRAYGQESGRAGRDGMKSIAVVFDKSNSSNTRSGHYGNGDMEVMRGESGSGSAEMRAFLTRPRCRRIALDQYLDGQEDRWRCKTEEGEVDCDNCGMRERQEALARQMEQETQETMEEETIEEEAHRQFDIQEWERQEVEEISRAMRSENAIEMEQLEWKLEEWTGKCAICYAEGREIREVWHKTSDCQDKEADAVNEAIRRFRRGIKYERFSCCFNCGIPQSICRHWEENGVTGGWRVNRAAVCQYPDVLAEATMAMMYLDIRGVGSAITRWIEEDGFDARAEKEVYRWLGRMKRWHRLQVNQLTMTFYRAAEVLVR